MFENPAIAISELPRADDVDWQGLDPAYRRHRQMSSLLIMSGVALVLVMVTAFAGIPRLPMILYWTLWLVVLAGLLAWPAIALPKRGYVARDKDILFRQGVIWRSVTAIPFNRIQHVETSSTPLDRRYDLATLQLFTAGGSSGDLKIDGLNSATAEQLRVFVLGKAGASIENA